MRTRTRLLAAAGTLALTAPLLHAASASAAAAAPARPYDFNGDGYSDTAMGVPTGTAGGANWAGYVAVTPGSATGPVPSRATVLSQSSAGVPGSSEEYDQFGAQIGSGDLDADGYAELIVAAPGESTATGSMSGRVTVLWGGRSGFTAATVIGGGQSYDGLGGKAVEAGDVTGDGTADLVLGSDGDEVDDLWVAAGPFRRGGTATATIVRGMPHFSGLGGLALGDFDGDGRTDVAAAYGALESEGTLLLRGTPGGLQRADDWYDESSGVSAVAGDFDADGYADIAYGVARHGYVDDENWQPEHPVAPAVGGTVRVLFGSPQGPAGTRPPLDLSQETPGVPGTGAGDTEQGDRFGMDLAAADADGDGHLDLAVGVPGEDIGAVKDAGAATMLYGTPSGPSPARARSFHQGTPGVPGSNEKDDAFGESVRLSDATGDGRPELLTAAPGEDTAEARNAGRVLTLPGGPEGPTPSGTGAYGPAALGLPTPHGGLFLGRVLR